MNPTPSAKPTPEQPTPEQPAHPEDGQQRDPSLEDPAPPSGAVLDAVCRSVVQLAGAAAHPPRRIRMQDGQTTVEVEWPDPVRTGLAAADNSPAADRDSGGPASGSTQPDGPQSCGAESGRTDLLSYVRAPMVGTFYHASAPDAQPYVSVGDVVRPGQPVGVLEAMKMMSTITTAAGGRVVEMVAPNAHPVEFDQQLIALAPVDLDPVDS